MSSGDPAGLTAFLEKENLKPGILPRYVGNRLHILFHLAGVIFKMKESLAQYLKK